MIFELLGYILTSLIAAALLAFKISNDIYPKVLKRKLIRIAVSNWQKKLIPTFSVNNSLNPVCTEDLGIFGGKKDYEAEQPEDVIKNQTTDELLFYGVDFASNCFLVKMSRNGNDTHIDMYIKIHGKTYSVHKNGITNSQKFSLGNLKLEMNEPMRSWRIWYNGALEGRRDSQKDPELVHAVINILWKSIDVPYDSIKNANTELLCEYLTGTGAFGEKFTELPSILSKGYYQLGTYHGTIKIENVDCDPVYLYGFRVRSILEADKCSSITTQDDRSIRESNTRLELFGMLDSDGDVFRISGRKDGWTDGYVMKSSYFVKPILNIEGTPDQFLKNSTLPKLISLTDDQANYRIEIWPAVEYLKFPNFEVVQLKLSVNGHNGTGVLLRKLPSMTPFCGNQTMSEDIIRTKNVLESLQWRPTPRGSRKGDMGQDIISLNSEECRSISLVGGKGASLAYLASLGQIISEFKTAKGFCVTTDLFRKSIDLSKVSSLFEETERELETICKEVMNFIKSSDAEKKIYVLVQSWLKNVFEHTVDETRFAVRSSGVLEDASDLSCAGQNDTFLGIDAENVPKKIVECWASLFTPQSVQYRLNHGQPAVSEMGVVIQEMVNAKVAGVLFTADPLTGSPFEMIITANFGLGESVVSASTDPDTLIVLRPRKSQGTISIFNEEHDLLIGKKSLGQKKTKIVLSSNGKSTEEVHVSELESENYCLKDEQALKLGSIGVKIETILGQLKPVDIEWAIGQNGEIFILQTRAVTSLDSWTDFELKHEFDTAFRSPLDIFTTANTGEVMPNTMTPLSTGLTARLLDSAIQRRYNLRVGDEVCGHTMRRMICTQQRILLNSLQCIYRSVEKEITPAMVCSDVSVYGHKVIDDETLKKAIKRFGVATGKEQLQNFILAIKGLMASKQTMTTANDRFGKYYFPYKDSFGDLGGLYERISEEIIQLHHMMYFHSSMSEISSVSQVFAFLILSGGRKVEEWDSDLYEDGSTIMAVRGHVESADMPKAMEELADKIVNHGDNIDEFLDSEETKQAIDWIKRQDVLHNALQKFFSKHGHRCISELDIGAKSWQTDPTPLITLLKSIVSNKIAHKDTWTVPTLKQVFADDTALVNSLKTPLSNIARCLLKFLIPSFRNSVMHRERTKSLLVKTTDQLKKAYYRLAELMVQQKLIPDGDAVFFMTHPEIGQLIRSESSSAKILYKVMKRRKLFTSLNKDIYPEVIVGYPQPINEEIEVEIVDSITGTPVSTGKVQGTVKVCRSVEEASAILKPGDILITHGTDIAWSPFFPLLGGVVTELGGLISHGAVVAREYGLPCIVGAVNATKIFTSGEQVYLDAGKGILSKIKVSK